MKDFTGTIKNFGGNFAPKDWMYCAGQLLAISQYPNLFAVIGNRFGGDGRTTFGLPDLKDRTVIGPNINSVRPMLPPIDIGTVTGSPTHEITEHEMLSHRHNLIAQNSQANNHKPSTGMLLSQAGSTASGSYASTNAYNNESPDVSLNPNTLSMTGSGHPHNNMQPFLSLSYIICFNGVAPPRT